MAKEQYEIGFEYHEIEGVGYYSIPAFERTGLVHHGFSTRVGGVSTGECSGLNLGFKRKDARENVLQNFHSFCRSIGATEENLVLSDQVHEDRIYLVSEKDRGKGFNRESDIIGQDGLITDTRGVPLVTFYADCVPLFFLDPVNRAIGTTHAGWRGTVRKIGVKTILKMREVFGTQPEDCLVGIGPSIGPCCFEVDAPVKDHFIEAFKDGELIKPGTDGKFFIDLWKANARQLSDIGVLPTHITVAGHCTRCMPERFFSHRRDAGKTGSLAAIIELC